MDSKDTCRVSNEERTARQNPSLKETALSKREQEISKRDPSQQRLSNNKIEVTPAIPQEEHHERTIRSRGRILTAQGEDYY